MNSIKKSIKKSSKLAMRSAPVWAAALLILACGFVQESAAQQSNSAGTANTDASDPDTPFLNHQRHLHPHNAPLPTEPPTEKRFYTTRASDVVLPLPTEKDAFVFAVFGDRTGGPAEGVNILADAVRDVNLVEPDLVMTVGDLINGYNQTDEWKVQMREYKTIMDELLCPWFPVAGNHDVYWRPLDDPNMPQNQHDEHYEMYFGPLWYSFKHKNCNFIVLYSDEGDPESGMKSFSEPKAQRISDEQLAFLKEALKRGEGDDHQFIFLHHPRWLGGGYGEDWKQRVHPLLKETGNVTAVFAGHIHRMRYDPKDGIEYVTLATVGGGQSGVVPEAGFLHHYHLITVRPEQVAMAAFPVGQALNVREITGEMQAETVALAQRPLNVAGAVVIDEQGVHGTTAKVSLDNPVSRPIDYTLTASSRDNRWLIGPDHIHGRLEPGESVTRAFKFAYQGETVDDAFDTVRVVLDQDYLAPTKRYSIPSLRKEVALDLQLSPGDREKVNRALAVDGNGDYVRVPASQLQLPQGPFTFECWFRAKAFGPRVGLMAKTQGSEYGVFVSNGVLESSAHFGGQYRTIKREQLLRARRWYHVASVFDGSDYVLYLDGKEVGRRTIDPSWQRKTNEFPFYIGADPDGAGRPMSFFNGMIDEVRVCRSAKYNSEFEPARRLDVDQDTVLYYAFDRQIGPMVFGRGSSGVHARLNGDAKVVPVD